MKQNLALVATLALPMISNVSVADVERPDGITDEIDQYIEDVIAEKTAQQDDFDFNGYFRAGSNMFNNSGSKNAGSCYSLPFPKNDGFYYRLGNECRDYSEFAFTKKMRNNGADFKAVWMMDIAGDSRSSTATEPWSRRTRQLYVQADNVLESGASIWVGRRYYRAVATGDEHMTDMFHVTSSGNGVGITDFPIGENHKLNVAFLGFGGEGTNAGNAGEAEINFQNLLTDVRTESDLGSVGKLKMAVQNLTVRQATEADLTPGYTVTAQWEKAIGPVNQKIVYQHGVGSHAENPGCAGTDGGCYNYTADRDSVGYRVFNNGFIDFGGNFKLNYLALYQNSEDYHTLQSVGIRPHYAISRYWSVLGEVAHSVYDRAEQIDGTDPEEQTLTKYTLALQATADASSFWERPSIRLYVSNFFWNEAAGLSLPGGEEADSAVVLGAQTEVWF